jgi:hypothetical protein
MAVVTRPFPSVLSPPAPHLLHRFFETCLMGKVVQSVVFIMACPSESNHQIQPNEGPSSRLLTLAPDLASSGPLTLVWIEGR